MTNQIVVVSLASNLLCLALLLLLLLLRGLGYPRTICFSWLAKKVEIKKRGVEQILDYRWIRQKKAGEEKGRLLASTSSLVREIIGTTLNRSQAKLMTKHGDDGQTFENRK